MDCDGGKENWRIINGVVGYCRDNIGLRITIEDDVDSEIERF
jgi:hypothetical protein